MSKQFLSLGAGVQSSAMTILATQGKIQVDEVIFADTGVEKPETYYYIENYLKPLLQEARLPLVVVKHPRATLEEYCLSISQIPSIVWRWCTDRFKVRPISKYVKDQGIILIGFSTDEAYRAERKVHKSGRSFPLLELGLSSEDCRRIIREYGWPIPIKSSCFFCPFQRWTEWNYLKSKHPDLMDRALELESVFHARKPHVKDTAGLFQGGPLWKYKDGVQGEMPLLKEYSCKSGYCGH